MVGTLAEAFKNMENGLYDYTENGNWEQGAGLAVPPCSQFPVKR